MKTRIFLIGMPGSGKSTSGKRFAKKLGWAYADLDKLVVIKAHKSIPKIFEEDGETAFRNWEQLALYETAQSSGMVVGCGGDRDAAKRPLMAAAAEQYAQHVVLTSDNPVYFFPWAGLSRPESELIFPIDQYTAMLATNESFPTATYFNGNGVALREINRRTMTNTNRHLITSQPLDWIPKLIANGDGPRRWLRVLGKPAM